MVQVLHGPYGEQECQVQQLSSLICAHFYFFTCCTLHQGCVAGFAYGDLHSDRLTVLIDVHCELTCDEAGTILIDDNQYLALRITSIRCWYSLSRIWPLDIIIRS